MKYSMNNTHIREIVDSLGEEYKDLLIEKALSQHGAYDVDEINVSTLVKIDEKAKESLYNDERKRKRNRLISIISMVGAIYCLMGLFLLLFYEIRNSYGFNTAEMFPYLMILMGLLVILLSLMLRNIPSAFLLSHKSEGTSKHFDYEVINVWKQIEGLLVQLTPTDEDMTLDHMIKYLADLKLLSSDDVLSIKNILNLRNQIVHSTRVEANYSINEIQSLLNSAYKIIKKLQKFENS